jgi:hypothetical protein
MTNWLDWEWDEAEMSQVENAFNVWNMDLEDSIMSETEDFATVTDEPFCGCDICMTRETIAFLMPKILDLYVAGHIKLADTQDRKMERTTSNADE